MKNFAIHCDTDVLFFGTEDQAKAQAIAEINACRREAYDGWDEELTGGICVMQVIHRAMKVDPNADYRAVDYGLMPVPCLPGPPLATGLTTFADGQKAFVILPAEAKNVANALEGLQVFGDYDGSKSELLGSLLCLCKMLVEQSGAVTAGQAGRSES